MVLIERFEAIPYALPFREPYVTARGKLERRDLILVRLYTDLGIEGLGEAAPLALREGPALEAIFTDLEDKCRPVIEGANLEHESLEDLVGRCREAGVSLQAQAAVEIALQDLGAKVAGQPLWKQLGAERAEPVRCNATLIAAEPERVAASAVEWAERGFETFKLKLGAGRERDTLAAVREAVGAKAKIRVDANAVWETDEAIAQLRELDPLGIEMAEQPAAELEDLAAVRKAVSIPIAADESVVDAADAREAKQREACDAATAKLAKCGGIGPALEVAQILPTYLSSALDGPIGIAAAAHAAQLIPDVGFAHGLATAALFSDTIASTECELDGPLLKLGDEPGLGVELDRAALKRCRL